MGDLLVQKRHIKTLMSLGLTLQESRIYCSLVEMGPSKVENIAKISKTSRSDVYRTIKKIRHIGIIECRLTKPFIYRAVPPKLAINSLLDDAAKDFEKTKALSLKLLKELEQKTKKNSEFKKEDFIFLPSKQAIIEKIKKSVKKTNNSIDILTTTSRLTQSCYTFCDCLQEACSRNVKIRVLIPMANKKQLKIFKKVYSDNCCEFRFLKSKPKVVIVIYDKKEVSIFTDSSETIKDSTSFWSNNNSILFLAMHYFKCNWNRNCDKINECLESISKKNILNKQKNIFYFHSLI